MASIHKKQNGTLEIRFMFSDKRLSFYPGRKATKKNAESIGVKLDKLAFAASQSESPPSDVAEWLRSLSDRHHDRLASWGLVQRRTKQDAPVTVRLQDWTTRYIGRGVRKDSTNGQLEDVARNLIQFFGADRAITDINAGDAEEFRQWLKKSARKVAEDAEPSGLAKNTVRRRIGRAREFFAAAMRREIITVNPFAGEAVTVEGNPERQFFVPSDWIERCIQASNCEDWRIILAFARYAGMRSHEARIQRWEDIDIPNGRMIVRSNKTPPTRVCPIFPELLPHLMRAREMAPEGAVYVQNRYSAEACVGTTLTKIIKRAGLEPWPKAMQNLRATRETELIARYPIRDVASWLGNSAPIAMKHYAMAMKESFERAIRDGAGGVIAKTPHKVHHAMAATGNQQESQPKKTTPNTREIPQERALVTAGDAEKSTGGGT